MINRIKYKNKSEREIRFRAFNAKDEKVVFILKPGEEVELREGTTHPDLEVVGEEKKTKKKIGGKK